MARRLGISKAAVAAVALAAATLVACGGGGAPTGPAGTAGTTSGPGATTGSVGEPALDDPCSMLTAAEVESVLKAGAVTVAGTPGDPAKCQYLLASGEEVLIVDVLKAGADSQFQAFVAAGAPAETPLVGADAPVGDQLFYEPGTGRLLIRKGDYLFILFSRYIGSADDAYQATIALAIPISIRVMGGQAPEVTAPPVVSAETACDLLSAEEAAGVLGKGAMEAQDNEFTPQFCSFALTATDEPILSIYLEPTGGEEAWAGYESSLFEVETVTGLGDEAMFEPSSGTLYARKGNAIVNAALFLPETDDRLAHVRQLVEIMLGNL